MAQKAACRFCWHAVPSHDPVQGCQHCSCLALASEALPRLQSDLDREPLAAGAVRPDRLYKLKETPVLEDQDVPARTLQDVLQDVLRPYFPDSETVDEVADEVQRAVVDFSKGREMAKALDTTRRKTRVSWPEFLAMHPKVAAVGCPKCKTPPGGACVTAKGWGSTRGFHSARIALADATEAQDAE